VPLGKNTRLWIDGLKELKLLGMATTFDEAVIEGICRKQTIQEILGDLIRAEKVKRQTRSIRYQMKVARFPTLKALDGFDFTSSQINEERMEMQK
jgi:hypothetical protein